MKKKSLGKSSFKTPKSISENKKLGRARAGSLEKTGRDVHPRLQGSGRKVQTIKTTRLQTLVKRRDYAGMLRIVTPELFRRGLRDASVRGILLRIEMQLCREGERLLHKREFKEAMKFLERVMCLGGRLKSHAQLLIRISARQLAGETVVKSGVRGLRVPTPPHAGKAVARKKKKARRPAPVAQRGTRPDIEVAERPHDDRAGGDRGGGFLGVVGDEFMAEEEMEEPALMEEIQEPAGSTSPERRGEEERSQPEVVRRTPHMDLAPEAPLEPASSFEVWISVDTNPPKPGEATEEIELRGAPSQEEFPVNVTLIVSGHFELLEDSVKRMIIFRSKESSPVTFKVRCVPEFPVEQSAALSALFTYEEHPSGRVTRNFRVDSGKLVPVQRVQTEVINSRRTALEPKVALTSNLFKYDLTISILDTGENDSCHFRFIADATAIGKRLEVPWNVSQKTEQIVSNYMKGFVVQGLEAGTRRDELTGAGIQLFRATPPDFQNLFWEMIDSGKPLRTIMVVSDDPYIPWELMVPRRTLPGRIETRKPLGVEFCVGRWIRSDYVTAPQQITLERTYVVAPQYAISSKNLKWAPEEARFVCEKFKPSKSIEPADLNKIEEALREQGVTLLHFICHGAASTGANQTVYLRDMVNNLSCSVVEGSEEFVTTFFRDHTFVFLNACEVGRTAPALVGINGFATTFLRLGASGVVAALWSVKDNIAHEVAMTFYEKVLQDPQTPFAEILRDIRSQAYSGKAEDTYAAYCFYGSPLARRKVLQA